MIGNLKKLVKWMLESEVETRDNDDLLCALVDARVNPKVLHMSYYEARKNAASLGLYSTESITRERRELQEEFPELCGGDFITRRRKRRERYYRDYYEERKVDNEK